MAKLNISKLLSHTSENITFDEEKNRVDGRLSELLNSTDKDELYYVGTSELFFNYFEDNHNTNWKIRGVFEIGYPFVFPYGPAFKDGFFEYDDDFIEKHPNYIIYESLVFKPWYLFVFCKEEIDSIIIGFNNSHKLSFIHEGLTIDEPWFGGKENIGKPFYVPLSFYFPYYKAIQKILQKKKIIERRKEYEIVDKKIVWGLDYEFNEIPLNSFDLNHIPLLFRYKKSVVNILGLPYEEDYILLKTVVDFVDQNDDRSFTVKKGDILIDDMRLDGKKLELCSVIRIAEKDTNELNLRYVIRTTDISPYYLYAYLKSDFVKEYCYHVFFAEPGEEEDSFSDLQIDVTQLPLLISSSIDNNYFKKKYEFEQYEKIGIQRKAERTNDSRFYNKNAQEIIIKDMDELRYCFNAKAYKAAIILAGSILESFLIDWLSEIKGVNYFENDFMVYDKYRNIERRANLFDYINEIEEIRKPNWTDAAHKSHEIRKKRNLVHAKLYVDDKDISKENCAEIISYLEFIINTRWK